MALGIVAFENTMTGSIDFISFTNQNLDSKEKLTKGKTILANIQDGRYPLKEKKLSPPEGRPATLL